MPRYIGRSLDSTINAANTVADGSHTDNKYNSGIWSISGGGDDSINTRRRSGKWGSNVESVLSRNPNFQIQFLIVGGGGAGGGQHYHAAGGGAGGMLTGTLGFVAGETLTVTVGAGGATVGNSTQGTAGGNSVVANPTITTSTALGGGGGARGYGPSGAPSTRDGGSGGGGGGNSGASMISESYLGGDGNQTAPDGNCLHMEMMAATTSMELLNTLMAPVVVVEQARLEVMQVQMVSLALAEPAMLHPSPVLVLPTQVVVVDLPIKLAEGPVALVAGVKVQEVKEVP